MYIQSICILKKMKIATKFLTMRNWHKAQSEAVSNKSYAWCSLDDVLQQ